MEVNSVKEEICNYLKSKGAIFNITDDTPEKFQVIGTIPTMQGKQKVPGFYFATVMPKPKDVRFYYFPIYTHKEEVGEISERLQKALKGKSCFHIKKWDDEMKSELFNLIDKGIQVYKDSGLLE